MRVQFTCQILHFRKRVCGESHTFLHFSCSTYAEFSYNCLNIHVSNLFQIQCKDHVSQLQPFYSYTSSRYRTYLPSSSVVSFSLFPVSSTVQRTEKMNNVQFCKQYSFTTHENISSWSVREDDSLARAAPTMLSQLPDDVLYHILSYLDYKSLSRLSQVCKITYQFVNRDAVWRRIAKDFLNTGITRNGTDM